MYRAAAFALAALLLSACSRPPALSSPDAGRSMGVEEADLAFDLEVGLVGDSTLEIAVGIPLASLRFVPTGDSATGSFRAPYALSVRLTDARQRATLRSSITLDTVVVRGAASTERDSSVLHLDTFEAPPGRYAVVAEVEAQGGRRRAERRLVVQVPRAGEPAVSTPRLARCREGRCRRDPGFLVPAPFDSLHLSIWARTAASASDASLMVYRYRRDTTVARPPYWVGPPPGSLAARGLSTDTADAVRTSARAVSNRGGTLTFAVGPLLPGVYGARARVGETESARSFGVAPAGFPQPSTLSDAIDALAYIAYADELRAMRAADGPAQRAAFDAFWARTAGDRVTAERMLQRYYARVAEANRRFTAYKLGWKTDRGMIYVVFGPPAYVDRTFTGEVWHYGASGRPSETFTFERGAGYGTTGGPFEPYLLQRNPAYEQPWRRAVRVWRSGRAD